VRDVDDLSDLKRAYFALVKQYGEEVAELKAFKQSLLNLNRRHRLEAAKMYASIISRVEEKVGHTTRRGWGLRAELATWLSNRGGMSCRT
jgi:hypothetical protein